MKAVVFTLGCKVNQCESLALMEGLKEIGYEVSDELDYADIYIINTCAVTAEAEKKSRQTVARVLRYNPEAKIIITGCASQHSPKSFSGKKNVFLITGAKSKDKIIDLLNFDGTFIEKEDEYYEKFLPLGGSRTRTYIKVQDGCNNFCSYCIVPYLRGRSRSRDPESVKREIEKLSPVEAVITGINLSDYNYNGLRLGGLLSELKDYDMRVRLGSLEVGVIDEDFLGATETLRDFAPHFHLSLQSGSEKVLKSMNRKYTPDEYIKKVDLIRKYYPDAAITTDIIVGFFTEDISDFNDTLTLVDHVGFADIHCFPYSVRAGTVASKRGDLPAGVKKERLDILLGKKAECKAAFAKKSVGTVHEFIPEERSDEYVTGYTGNYLRVYVKGGDLDLKKYKVRIVSPYLDGAIAEIIK